MLNHLFNLGELKFIISLILLIVISIVFPIIFIKNWFDPNRKKISKRLYIPLFLLIPVSICTSFGAVFLANEIKQGTIAICGNFTSAKPKKPKANSVIVFELANDSKVYEADPYYQDFFNSVDKQQKICFEKYPNIDSAFNLYKI